MNVEVGKTYKLRNGTCVMIYSINTNYRNLPIFGYEIDKHEHDSGWYCWTIEGKQHDTDNSPFDIIKLL